MKSLIAVMTVFIAFSQGALASGSKAKLDVLKKELSVAKGEKRSRLMKKIADLENKITEKKHKLAQ